MAEVGEADAVADLDVVGAALPEVVGFEDVEGAVEVAELDVSVDEAGACGLLWKSLQVSVRKVSPPAVTLSAVGVTV